MSSYPEQVNTNARTRFLKSGTLVGVRRALDFIPGTNVTITTADDGTNEKVTATFAVASAAPSGAAGGDLTGTYPNPTIASNIVTPAMMNATAWTAWTPTVTAGSGTFTTVSGAGRYLQLGKFVAYSMTVTITTNGTAATSVRFTLPVNQVAGGASIAAGYGRASAISGKTLQVAFVSSTQADILNYDNTYPGATGETLQIAGHYEAV